jgi:DDE superfamily endonuclease
VKAFADKGYQGAGGTIRTPFKRHRHRPWLSRGQKNVNRSHARIRALGERVIAILKTWKVLIRLRCPRHRDRAGLLALQALEGGRYSGQEGLAGFPAGVVFACDVSPAAAQR